MSPLGRTVDALIQSFEDRRPGLTENKINEGPAAVAVFFTEIYDQERERLKAQLLDAQPQLSEGARQQLFSEVDVLIRRTMIPAYVRLAAAFTPKERNDFFILPANVKVVERVAWAFAGMILGYLVVLAPFIPLSAKEWVLPFVIAGLVFPELRRLLAFRRYERDLNQLVQAADRELARLDRAYLTSGTVIDELERLGKE